MAAAVVALLAAPAIGAPGRVDPLGTYARARAAGTLGAEEIASRDYAAALAFAPDNSVLAARALSHALAAGDRALAVAAARALEKSGELAPDARLLLLTEALREKDWRGAEGHVAAIEKDEIFAFMAPILRAWLSQGSRRGDPLALLAGDHQLTAVYVAEHRPLLLLAKGDLRQGAAELLSSDAAGGPRGERLRLAAAATLARKGKKQEALSLLVGDSLPIAAARATLQGGRKLRGEVASAQAGVSELLTRMAIDLNGEEVPQLALSFARLAIFLASENSQARLVASQLLNLDGKPQAALAVLADLPADDPYAGNAAEARFGLLAAAGRQEEALRLATAATERPGAGQAEWARLGDLYMEMKRHGEAAHAYEKALAIPQEGLARPEWALRLQQGDALVQAGKWQEGREALKAAHALAPAEAVVLNYLGYAQLERRENMDEAERLIREASRLDPENHAITDSLGWALHLRGKHVEAIPLLERAAEGEPADAAIAEHLGDAYYSAGRRFEARHAWSAALVTADSAATTRLRAKIEAGLKPELASP